MQNDLIYRELKKNHRDAFTEAVDIILYINKLYSLILRRKESLFADYGVTPVRFNLLLHLKSSSSDFSLTPTELAKKMHIKKGTLTQYIDHLMKDGLVERTKSHDDKRMKSVTLTSRGIDKISVIIPLYLSMLENCTSGLDEQDHKIMKQAIKKMIIALSPSIHFEK